MRMGNNASYAMSALPLCRENINSRTYSATQSGYFVK